VFFTIFISGFGANFEIDLKKIIALSTLRQLGLIIMSLGMGFYEYAFLHLLTHAIFKSLLFLCAGVFIHSMGDIQDIRLLGGLSVSCPVTSFYFITSSIALCGFPFLSGFYSKDIILEIFFLGGANLFIFFIVVAATIITLTYRVRLGYYVFFNNIGGRRFTRMEEEIGILAPIGLLVFLSVAAGGWTRAIFFPLRFIYLPFLIKIFILVMILLFFILWFSILSFRNIIISDYTRLIKYFLGSIWLLPFLSTALLTPSLKVGRFFLKFVDQGWVEILGGPGFIKKSSQLAVGVDLLNKIGLKFYLFSFFIIITLIFLVVVYFYS